MIASSILLDGSPLAVALSSSSDASFTAVMQGEGTQTSDLPATPGTEPGTTGSAPDGPPPQGNPFQSIITFALIGAVVWFLIFAPERKARKKREVMLSAVKKGDKIVTTGGMHGEVVDVKEHTVIVKAGEARLTFSRASIHEIRQPKDDSSKESE